MSSPIIENVIVVMLENRSYDNILGGLYLASNGAPYNAPPSGQAELNGLANSNGQPGSNFYNPNPNVSGQTIPIGNQTTPTQIGGAGTYYPPTTIPVIDPGEFGSLRCRLKPSLIRTVWDIFLTNAQPPNPPSVSSLTQRDCRGKCSKSLPIA